MYHHWSSEALASSICLIICYSWFTKSPGPPFFFFFFFFLTTRMLLTSPSSVVIVFMDTISPPSSKFNLLPSFLRFIEVHTLGCLDDGSSRVCYKFGLFRYLTGGFLGGIMAASLSSSGGLFIISWTTSIFFCSSSWPSSDYSESYLVSDGMSGISGNFIKLSIPKLDIRLFILSSMIFDTSSLSLIFGVWSSGVISLFRCSVS